MTTVGGELRRRLLTIVFTVLVMLVPAATPVPPARDAHGYGCLAVGAWVGDEGTVFPAQRFAAANADIGPLTIRRSFDATLPATFDSSAASGDPAAGVSSFVSWKPPGGDHGGAAAGAYDRQITAWARSVPTTGVFATAFHEPENDMTAGEFVAFQRHVYRVVKAANPTIHWGPVYMAYWWDPAEPDHYVGDPQAWWPGDGFADFVGLDWYGDDPTPMTASPSFRQWYEVMAPTGLPLMIPEYGQSVTRNGPGGSPALELARARAITQDARWIAAHPQLTGWLYWQGFGPRGTDWRLTDPLSVKAWRAAASDGCGP